MEKGPGRLPPAEPKARQLAATIVRMHPVGDIYIYIQIHILDRICIPVYFCMCIYIYTHTIYIHIFILMYSLDHQYRAWVRDAGHSVDGVGRKVQGAGGPLAQNILRCLGLL